MGKAFKIINMIAIVLTVLVLLPIFNTIRGSSSAANITINILHFVIYVISLALLMLERLKNKLAIHVTSLIVAIVSLNIAGIIGAIVGIVTHNKKEINNQATNEEIKELIIDDKIPNNKTTKLVISKGCKILFILSIILIFIYMALYIILISIFYIPTLPEYFDSLGEETASWPLYTLFIYFFSGMAIIVLLLIPISIFILLISSIILTMKKRHYSLLITNIVLGFMFLTIFNAIASIITLVNDKYEE